MRAVLLASTLAFAATTGANAQEALRPALGKPLEAAKSYLASRNCARAMASVRAADAVGGKSAYESFVTEEMRGAVAQQCGDTATASRTYQQMLDSGRVSGAEAQRLMLAEVSMAYTQRNYANVVYWAERYIKSGGTDPNVRTFLIQGYYLQGKYAEAGQLQSQQIAAAQKAGQRPTENQLQLLYNCQQHTNDAAGSLRTMYQLLYYYPKPDYWLNVIDNLRRKPGFSDRLTLDVDRLQLALGLIKTAADYMEMTELALQVPLPGEAKAIVDQGYTAGALGTGTEAPRQQRLRDLVQRTYDSELKALPAAATAAANEHDGNHLVAVGAEYVSYGQYDQGLALMQQGIQKGGLDHPEDVKLHLGLAYLKAGRKPQAVATLRSVDGREGAGDLARLWLLYLSHPMMVQPAPPAAAAQAAPPAVVAPPPRKPAKRSRHSG